MYAKYFYLNHHLLSNYYCNYQNYQSEHYHLGINVPTNKQKLVHYSHRWHCQIPTLYYYITRSFHVWIIGKFGTHRGELKKWSCIIYVISMTMQYCWTTQVIKIFGTVSIHTSIYYFIIQTLASDAVWVQFTVQFQFVLDPQEEAS